MKAVVPFSALFGNRFRANQAGGHERLIDGPSYAGAAMALRVAISPQMVQPKGQMAGAHSTPGLLARFCLTPVATD